MILTQLFEKQILKNSRFGIEFEKILVKFHVFLGIMLFCVHIYVVFNLEHVLPKMPDALSVEQTISLKGRGSIRVVLSMPLFSICCFLFPKWLSRKFSRRSFPLGEPVVTEGGWYFLGYLLILLFTIACLGFV